MTSLRQIFSKPVDRPIEGVIKADDEASLRLEIEEYVLTNEVEQRLENFLDAYTNYENANGVWISGFFGSGKSHLLKMLALLLENREIDGSAALDLFIPKCSENEILRGDLKRAVSIPSKSILFNIDQKADVISKTQIDALLAVFVKVFDETCGYYGKQGHIAQFERELDSRDLFEKFKKAFESIAGKSWHTGREQALLESGHIARAYAQITGSDEVSAKGILDKYRSQYRVSIEDFASQINDWIDKQGPDFRLNFFVDEVGQYIAENVKLMTNLQTIAESLATKCRGRAWIIVTSQNDMTTVLGEMNRQQSNDFSKIMARFNNKMLLTSTNVSEVIQKRLLSKTDSGIEAVSDLYHQHSNNFGTLFSFTDGSREYKTYRDKDEFIRCYPFVPYQFELFQSAIENLSRHSAFEGKHQSVGERSMLGVFQQVAKQLADLELGQLATFDLMFEGIQSTLKAQTQQSVQAAQRQLDNPFAVRLLKALFLVKYVKAFKPSIRNLCVLMYDSFDQNLTSLKKRIEESLNLLEQQTYIQRNGELYEFLTDEEKDIEQEIKSTDVESSSVTEELVTVIFENVIKSRKIRYDENNQDFAFTRKLDDRAYSRESNLSINIITPFHEHAENWQAIINKSVYSLDELYILLPPDDRLMRDTMMYKKTEKYIKQNFSSTQQETVKRILQDKSAQNQERYQEIKQRIQLLMSKATMFVAGKEIEVNSEDAQTRVIRAFHELIGRAYPNLQMLRGIAYTENDIALCLKRGEQGLFGNDATPLTEPEQEMFAFIHSNAKGGVRTTLKSVMEKFEGKQYGWYYAAILCTVANLCARSKVEVRVDGNLIDDTDLEKHLRNTHTQGNVVLDPQVDFSASQVRALKDFFGDFFDAPPQSNEAKPLGNETGAALNTLLTELKTLGSQSTHYPFLIALTPVIDALTVHVGKPYNWYLTEILKHEDALIKLKESTIDPLRKFMAGTQKTIYDTTRRFIEQQKPNAAYLDQNAYADLVSGLSDPLCFKGSQMQSIKTATDSLQDEVNALLNEERQKASTQLENLQKKLEASDGFTKITAEQQQQIRTAFKTATAISAQSPLVAVIRETVRHFEDQQYPALLNDIDHWLTPTPAPVPGEKTQPGIREESRYVAIRTVNVSFDKAWIESEQDIDDYLKALRKALEAELNNKKRIQV